MTDVQIKNYYNNKYPSIEVDFSSQIHEKIKGNSKNTAMRLKLAVVIAIMMMMSLGCGFLIVNHYLGDDGRIVWRERYENRSMKDMTKAYDIYASMELHAGEVVQVLFNDGHEIYSFQEPWVGKDYDSTLAFTKKMDIEIPQAIGGFEMLEARYYNHSGSEVIEVFAVPDDFVSQDDYYYKISNPEPTVQFIQADFGSDGRIKLEIYRFDAVEQGMNEQQSLDVTYYKTQEAEPETLMVNGIEGRVLKHKDVLEYAVYYQNLYITLTCQEGEMSSELFADLVMAITK